MGYGLIDNNTLLNIADAIREKTNSNANYYPRDMARAISQINTSGVLSTPIVLSMKPYMALNDYGYYTTNNYNNTTYFTGNMREFVFTNNLPNDATILTRADWEGYSPHEVYLFESNNAQTVGLYCENVEPESISIIDMSSMFSGLQYNFNQNAFCTDLTECMDFTYNYCTNITGSAACGEHVRYMRFTYNYCNNLTNAVCGNNVVDMCGAYKDCKKLTAGVSGPCVLNMEYSYYASGISELDIGPLVEELTNCAPYCNNLTVVTGGENVVNAGCAFNRCFNLTDVSAMPNIRVAPYMFSECYNLSNESAYAFMLAAENLTHAAYMFNGCSLIEHAYLWDNLNSIQTMFNGCTNLISVGYSENFNLTYPYGAMDYTFMNCHNLLEPIPCPDIVNTMRKTYCECRSLRNYIIGNNVDNLYNTFYNCQNLTTDVTMGEKVNCFVRAFYNCYQIQNFAILNNNLYNSWELENTFYRTNNDLRRNIVFANFASLSMFFSRNMAGQGINWTPVTENVEVNVGGVNYNTVRYYYNTTANCYVYCME